MTEAIRNYGRVGEALYKTNGIIEAAKQLSEMADAAQNHVLSETSDWFDSVSVKRNMKELKGLTGQFKKTADNSKLMSLIKNYQFTDINKGIKETVQWFKDNFKICRK